MIIAAIIVEREGTPVLIMTSVERLSPSSLSSDPQSPCLPAPLSKRYCGLPGTGSHRRWARYCGCDRRILPTMADREEAPVLIMIVRRKAFTVLGLMFMRFAIALLARPCSRYSNTSRSRGVRLNCRETSDNGTNPEGPRSNSTAMLGCEGSLAHESTQNARQKYRLLPDRNSVTKCDSLRA